MGNTWEVWGWQALGPGNYGYTLFWSGEDEVVAKQEFAFASYEHFCVKLEYRMVP